MQINATYARDPVRVRDASITREGPNLARCCGHLRCSRYSKEIDDHDHHGLCTTETISSVVNLLNERLACSAIENGIYVADSKDERGGLQVPC
jgi:hypothetical protein